MDSLAYHIRNILIAIGCVAASAIVGLLAAMHTDSVPEGVVAALVVLALYGVCRYLFQTLGPWLHWLPITCFLLMVTAFALGDGDWFSGACTGAFSLLAVRHLFSLLQDDRNAVDAAREWESRCGSPAVRPCPVLAEQLVANLQGMAEARPETVSLNHAATLFECRGDAPEFRFIRTFILCRKGDDWSACFVDPKNNPDRPCIPRLAVRHIFIRETGGIEPAIMEAVRTPMHGLVFHRNGELRIYPATLADEFLQTWGSSLFATGLPPDTRPRVGCRA